MSSVIHGSQEHAVIHKPPQFLPHCGVMTNSWATSPGKEHLFSSIASRICGWSPLREARLIKIAETKEMKNKVPKGSVVALQL